MKAFWNDNGRGPDGNSAKEVSLEQAHLIWSDEVRGMKGNFFGLVDDQDNTVQFYFDEGIPDHVDYAGDLQIVYMDFPMAELHGSYARHVRIDEVHGFIDLAFKVGADYRKFGQLQFESW